MGPSLEIGTNKQKENREKSRKLENVTCDMEESGGKFPPLLINSMEENQKWRKKRGKKKKGEEKEKRRRKREKWEEKEKEIFPGIPTIKARWSEN